MLKAARWAEWFRSCVCCRSGWIWGEQCHRPAESIDNRIGVQKETESQSAFLATAGKVNRGAARLLCQQGTARARSAAAKSPGGKHPSGDLRCSS